MSYKPETIWVDDSIRPWRVWRVEIAGLTEYRRADLPPTPAQIMADPRVKALVEALRKIKRVTDTPIQSNRKLGQYCYRWADIDDAIESVDAALSALDPKP